MRQRTIKSITFIAGLYYFLEFVLPSEIAGHKNYLSDWIVPVGQFFIILWAFAKGLGALNLSITHSRNIRRRKPGWAYSLVFFIAMIAMMVACYLNTYHPTPAAKSFYNLLFIRMYMPLGATIFSLLALYMASAAYRAMKVRTLEGAVMMVAAIIIMLGQVPVGLWLTASLPTQLQLPRVASWLLWIANTAAYRAVMFGIAIGAIAMALRVWLSLERGMELK
ncbi:MAG TPA: hypothetical protein EYP60_01340 [bacterium (Candidatus Stahlbacteria)]|nr:hypothetical protein [Candidatus Stahlbacteria bacterium]